MDVKEAIEKHVRQRLEDTFGSAVAMMILISASNKADMSMMNPNPQGYTRFVDAICTDDRVISMWGSSGTSDAAASWKTLV